MPVAKRTILIIFMLFHFQSVPVCFLNQEGVITHVPAGTGMPEKNAFGTPSVGRAPKAAFSLKLPVSRDSSRSRKYVCSVFSVSFFLLAAWLLNPPPEIDKFYFVVVTGVGTGLVPISVARLA
jgi:hypothetical protein